MDRGRPNKVLHIWVCFCFFASKSDTVTGKTNKVKKCAFTSRLKRNICLASPTLSVLQTSDRFEQAASVTNDATGQTRKSNYPVTTCGGRQLLGDVINSSYRSRTMFWKTETSEAVSHQGRFASPVSKSNISKSFFRIKNICRFKDTVSYFPRVSRVLL